MVLGVSKRKNPTLPDHYPTREPTKHKVQNRFTTLNIGSVPVHRSKSGFTMKRTDSPDLNT
ncbi:hypothetical protein HanIR_Chr15g0743171 [Helianthus annuus]|nr:hypothetical protein HanIR_Chr15g0743171 [Helianthus annuus]